MQIRSLLFFYLFCTVSTISAWTSNCISILFVSQQPHLPVILFHMKRSIMRSLSVIALLLWVRNFHFPLILAAVAAVSLTVISYHSLAASTSAAGSQRRCSIAFRVAYRLNQTTYLLCAHMVLIKRKVYSLYLKWQFILQLVPSKNICTRILNTDSRTRGSACTCILSENNWKDKVLQKLKIYF